MPLIDADLVLKKSIITNTLHDEGKLKQTRRAIPHLGNDYVKHLHFTEFQGSGISKTWNTNHLNLYFPQKNCEYSLLWIFVLFIILIKVDGDFEKYVIW